MVWSRYRQWKNIDNYVDKELDLIDIGDYLDYSLRNSKIINVFKLIYSLFDRLGYFINEYFGIGLTSKNINFKNV